MKISKDSQLAALKIPYLPMIIEEAFAVWQTPEGSEGLEQWTVENLADHAHLPVDGVLNRLRQIQSYASDIEIEGHELAARLGRKQERLFLLDVREPWEFSLVHLPGSQLMAKIDLAQIFEGLKELTVITICHYGQRSLSAALYLKEAGLPRVKSLKGGLDLWAQTLDPSMRRY